MRMIYFLLVPLCLYALLIAGMYTFQRKLMYLPDKVIAAPEQYGLEGFQDTATTTVDNHFVQLWYRPAKEGMPTMLYFHGNAAHLGNRAGKYHAFAEKGFGVLALSYRGYGKSQGEPSEEGIYNDARATIKFLTDKSIPLSRIMLFGESLGSGVAVQMATEFQVGAVILEAPYTSVVNRAAEIYSFAPVRLLIQDHYDSIGKIAKVKAPILIFHGALDQTIPIAHGKTLYEAIRSPKQAFYFPKVGHTDFNSDVLAAHILEFARTNHLVGEL